MYPLTFGHEADTMFAEHLRTASLCLRQASRASRTWRSSPAARSMFGTDPGFLRRLPLTFKAANFARSCALPIEPRPESVLVWGSFLPQDFFLFEELQTTWPVPGSAFASGWSNWRRYSTHPPDGMAKVWAKRIR